MMDEKKTEGTSPEFEGNPEHLAKLREGVRAWNSWRQDHPAERPDLRRAHLEKADLNRAHLEKANLRGAHLEKAKLRGAHLEKANLFEAHLKETYLNAAHLEKAYLYGAHLEKAKLRGAHLEKADLSGAHLEKADLYGAHLEEAYLRGAHLEETDLRGAHLKEANLFEAHLEKANLFEAHLEKADLYGASLKNSMLWQADLSGADLRVKEPEHLRLDDTRILKSRFAPRSRDPWSLIRRAYSGPVLLFHLLFLLVFLVPYLSRAAYWKGINAAQATATATQASAKGQARKSAELIKELEKNPTARQELEARWRSEGLDVERSRQILEEAAHRQRERVLAIAGVEALRPVERVGLCLQPVKDCGSPQPILPLILGLHQKEEPANLLESIRSGVLRFLAVGLILYNISRGFLTYYVSGLRDAEIRGGYSPRLREYIWVYYLHAYFLQYVPVAGLTAAAIQIAEWLLVTDVVLPAL